MILKQTSFDSLVFTIMYIQQGEGIEHIKTTISPRILPRMRQTQEVHGNQPHLGLVNQGQGAQAQSYKCSKPSGTEPSAVPINADSQESHQQGGAPVLKSTGTSAIFSDMLKCHFRKLL